MKLQWEHACYIWMNMYRQANLSIAWLRAVMMRTLNGWLQKPSESKNLWLLYRNHGWYKANNGITVIHVLVFRHPTSEQEDYSCTFFYLELWPCNGKPLRWPGSVFAKPTRLMHIFAKYHVDAQPSLAGLLNNTVNSWVWKTCCSGYLSSIVCSD